MEQPEGSLDDFVLRNILENLSIQDHLLLELRCLGTRLKTLIDTILKERFSKQWRISDISGSPPPSPTAFTSSRLCNFYRRHPVVAGESLSSIALKHGSDVSTIRRVNNIITDHTLASRNVIYVPVQHANLLEGCIVSFEYHRAAHNRPMFVVHPAPSDRDAHGDSNAGSAFAAPSTPTSTNNQRNKYQKSNTLLRNMLQRTLGIDATTAGYYLSAAGGDPKAAIAAYQEDQRWDAKMRHLKRSLGSNNSKKCK